MKSTNRLPFPSLSLYNVFRLQQVSLISVLSARKIIFLSYILRSVSEEKERGEGGRVGRE